MRKPLSILIFILAVFSKLVLSNKVNVVDTYSFLSLGDWGGYILNGYHAKNVIAVANACYNVASKNNVNMVLNTGDNFYYCGIQNITDYQIKKDYIDIFSKLNIPWYNTLGNHDYGYNVSAQLDLNKVIKNWIMDDRYYYRRITMNNTMNVAVNDMNAIHLIVLDTNPCVSGYRGNNRKLWDPCGEKYPTCSINHGNDTFEGECKFHQNIIKQDCIKQFNWFSETIYNIMLNYNVDKEWIIVMGHHPIDEIDIGDFIKIINSDIVDLYINGHKHELQHYSINGTSKYITTGAGSMVKPASGGDDDSQVIDLFDETMSVAGIRNKTKEILWSEKITGLTMHSIFNNTLLTEFLDIHSRVIYNFTISKTISKTKL